MKEYIIGSVVTGKVSGIEDYGIFLSFDNGTTGLIHISEISDSFVRNVSDYAKIDDIISAKVLDYDAKMDKLRLSIKALDETDKKKLFGSIKETKNGFESLKESLDLWVKSKLEEIDKN